MDVTPNKNEKPEASKCGPLSPIDEVLHSVYNQFRNDFRGTLADYIPELLKANPYHFGISIATIDGKIYEVGDSDQNFTIQSISKVFIYGLALSDYGAEEVLKHVGVEPSGDSFNSIIFDEQGNRPFNPMVNAGAIVTTALIKGKTYEERQKRMLDALERFVGHPLEIDTNVFESEKATGHRNRAIAYLELNSRMINEPINDHLNLYFLQCSALVNAKDLAVMAVTLANQGVNPLTGEQAQEPESIRRILSVMQSCGMYNFSGEWIFRVGLPAKSGISGGIIAVVPGLLGIGIYSPLLDDRGNSVRGIQVCETLSKNFNLHVFDIHPPITSIVHRFYTGQQVRSKRQRNRQEMEIFKRIGACIQVYELEGELYFSSVEQLCRRLSITQEGPLHVIFDCRHVIRIDPSVLPLLTSLKQSLFKNNIHLYIAAEPSIKNEILSKVQKEYWPTDVFFNSSEDALEYCENHLLSSENIQIYTDTILPFEKTDIADNLSKEEIEILKSIISEVHFSAGDKVIKKGDLSTEIFILASGVVGVYLELTPLDLVNKRIGAIGPGISFGEFGLFQKSYRTADVIAEKACVCYIISLNKIEILSQKHPTVYSQLLKNVGQVLAERLRLNNEELRVLSS